MVLVGKRLVFDHLKNGDFLQVFMELPIFNKTLSSMKQSLSLLHTFLVLIISSTFLLACNKNKRIGDFMLNQYEYAPGDALKFENLSTKYDSCVWEMIGPEGDVSKTVSGNYPNLVTGILFPDGIHKLRLTTFRNKKELTSEKDFLIKSDRIYLKVNSYSGSQGDQDDYDVFVDGQYVGSSNNYGTFSKQIPIGWRYVQLIAPTERIEGTYYFDPNEWDIYFEF